MASTNIWSAFKLMDPESNPVAMDTSREGSVSGSSFSGSFSGSGSNSTMSTTGTDEQGNDMLLALERKSVKPYRTKDEYLYAMKEDLAEWFNVLYNMNLTVDNFFEEIETGVLLCEHANNVQDIIRESFGKETPKPSNPRATPIYMADYVVTYKKNVKPGTFQSRDNISNFLTWCVRLGIPDNLRFESDDLVLRKHERNVILCLLEVARRGAKYGMLAPVIIQLEEEIDAEIAGKEPPAEPVAVIIQRKTCDLMSLDEMVRDMVSECTCPSQFPMVKVSDGKYRIGDSQTLIFVRILRNHVMVRIGGGWDTLENYLDRHDPCRCHARGHGRHRGSSPMTVQMKRRSSAGHTDNSLTGLEMKAQYRAGATIEEAGEEENRPPASPRKSSLGVAAAPANSTHSSPRKAKRSLPTIPANQTKRSTSPSVAKTEDFVNKASVSKSSSFSRGSLQNSQTGIPRPKSALERRHSDAVNHAQYCQWGSDEDLRDTKSSQNSVVDKRPTSALGMRRKDLNDNSQQHSDRSHTVSGLSSLIASEMNQLISPEEEVLVISRDDTGRHKIGSAEEDLEGNGQNRNTNLNNGLQKTFTSNKFQLAADKILPSKPKNMTRAASQSSEQGYEGSTQQYDKYRAQYSADSDSFSESSMTNGSSRSVPTSQVSRTWSQESAQSIDASEFDTIYNTMCSDPPNKNHDSTLTTFSVDDYPEAPPEDSELNRQMEELFEEYRRVEQGLFRKQKSADDLLASTEKRNSPKPKPKQDFSKVQSKLKEYFSNSPKKSSGAVTPRSSTPRTRPQTPTQVSKQSTPKTPRRSLPRAPSPALSSHSSSSSHSAFTPLSKTNNPSKTAQPSAWTAAWRQNKPSSELNKTTPLKGTRAARPSTPTGRPSTPVKAPPRTVISQKTTPHFRPASAPLHRPAEPKVSAPVQDTEDSGGFLVQSTGAWAVKTPTKNHSKSVPHTPAKAALTPKKMGSGASVSVSRKGNLASTALKSRSTACLTEGTVGESAFKSKDDMDYTLTKQTSLDIESLQSKPRKDTRNQSKLKTKIPMPVRCRSADPYSQNLKRCDSGVDINNVLPSGNTTLEEGGSPMPWEQTEGVALSPQAISEYSSQCSPFDDKNNEFF